MNAVARIYCRVSTEEQDLRRQDDLIKFAQNHGYYVAKVYREKASGYTANRKVLNELIDDLQEGEAVIVERVDRLSRLPLKQAQGLLARIEEKGASVVVPELIHLINMEVGDSDLSKLITNTIHKLLLQIMMDFAHTDYQSRRAQQSRGIALAKLAGNKYLGKAPNVKQHQSIIALAKTGMNTSAIAETLKCSASQVRRIKRMHKDQLEEN